MCRSWTIRSFWTNPYKDSRVTSPLKKRFVHFLVATHRDLHRLESFTSRSFIDPKTRPGGERLIHLPDRSLTWRHGREVKNSIICRIQIRSRSSFSFHVTCIGSALVARENRNDSFILTGSSDTDLRIIFHVTCAQKRKQKGFVYLVHFRVARFSKTWMIFLHR